jgi:hypothetical protein
MIRSPLAIMEITHKITLLVQTPPDWHHSSVNSFIAMPYGSLQGKNELRFVDIFSQYGWRPVHLAGPQAVSGRISVICRS